VTEVLIFCKELLELLLIGVITGYYRGRLRGRDYGDSEITGDSGDYGDDYGDYGGYDSGDTITGTATITGTGYEFTGT
jgi:hypothetical protein